MSCPLLQVIGRGTPLNVPLNGTGRGCVLNHTPRKGEGWRGGYFAFAVFLAAGFFAEAAFFFGAALALAGGFAGALGAGVETTAFSLSTMVK